MKEMTYTKKRTFDILYFGIHRDIRFWVISYGTHPCVYVDATKFRAKLGSDLIYSAPIHPHGGITYDEDNLRNVWDEACDGFEPGKCRIIGWDYAHLGDYDTFGVISSGKKWTTPELIDDARQMIDELFEL